MTMFCAKCFSSMVFDVKSGLRNSLQGLSGLWSRVYVAEAITIFFTHFKYVGTPTQRGGGQHTVNLTMEGEKCDKTEITSVPQCQGTNAIQVEPWFLGWFLRQNLTFHFPSLSPEGPVWYVPLQELTIENTNYDINVYNNTLVLIDYVGNTQV